VNDGNLQKVNEPARTLTDALNKLDRNESDPSWAVVPIYMAWRGKSWWGEPSTYNLGIPFVWQAAAPGAADLIIAVNPAIEAMALDNTVLSPAIRFSSDATGVTRLLILDAENDLPRRVLFPIGRTISQALSWHHFKAERVAAGREQSQIGYRLFAPDSTEKVCESYPTSDRRYNNRLVGYSVMDNRSKLTCVPNSVMIMRASDDNQSD
jgi:hypothetical protein